MVSQKIRKFDLALIEKVIDLIYTTLISGGQKKTHRTLDACRFNSIYSVNVIFHTCIAQSVLSNWRKFRYSNPTSSYDNVQDVP